MSWVLAVAGFALLIIVHELGHFVAAKAVGMRVERFSLFFGPMLVKFRRGETVYGIGVIPAGGYVKITGMNPAEELAPEIAPRAYFRQSPWKRIVVILAGPAVNILVAFLIFWVLLLSGSKGAAVPLNTAQPISTIAAVQAGEPASGVLARGDTVLSVDGVSGPDARLSSQIASHRCPGAAVQGCRASTPARVLVRRDRRLLGVSIVPRYDATSDPGRMRLGFAFDFRAQPLGPASAASISAERMWSITADTVTGFVHALYSSKARGQVHSVIGIATVTEQRFAFDIDQALVLVGFISLVLAVINLFPFLPLDGGHVLWAVAEKLRGRAIPLATMVRFSSVGMVLMVFLVISGVSNDITQLTGPGF